MNIAPSTADAITDQSSTGRTASRIGQGFTVIVVLPNGS